ncbi:nucleotidyltransferase domain-containing protein [Myceligenerans cantabricum]
MRLQREAPVAGIDPGLARDLARACLHDWTRSAYIAHVVKADVAEAERLLGQLESEGYVARKAHERGGEAELWWNTTLRGSGLASASFLKPIIRAKAETLLAGVLDRAAAYNADPDKPLWIEKISLFGSMLNETATDFGDVDLHVVLKDRAEHDETPPRQPWPTHAHRVGHSGATSTRSSGPGPRPSRFSGTAVAT